MRIDNRTLDVTQLTLEVSIQPRTFPTGSARAGVVDYERQFSIFVLASGTVYCAANSMVTSVGEVMLPGDLRAGVWTTVACTADATSLAIWIDGVMRASVTIDGFFPEMANPPGLAIGTNFPGPSSSSADPFDGLIDDLRIWRRIRTPQEICAAAVGCSP